MFLKDSKNLGADFLIGDDAHHYLESGSLG